MDVQPVLIYGNSLFIAGVAAQLSAVPGLAVQRVATATALGDRCPGVLVFDLTAVRADLVLGWLTDCAQLTLVGLDLRRSRVVVFSTGALQVASVEELGRLVRRLAPGGATGVVS